MRILLLIPFLYGCATAALIGSRSPDLQKFEIVRVMVKCPSMPGVISAGSGVIISEKKIITAGHVIPCLDGEIRATQPGGIPLAVKTDKISRTMDLARLVVKDPKTGFTDVAPTKVGSVKYGDCVCLVSSLPSQDRRCGIIDGLDTYRGLIRSSANVEEGNSGSPVYDSTGRLVGIVTNGRRARNGMGYFGSVAVSLVGREWVLQ